MNILKSRFAIYFINTFILTFILSSSLIAKQIYECNDSKGNVLYTDHPKTDPNCFNPVPKNVDDPRTVNLKNSTLNSIRQPDTESVEQADPSDDSDPTANSDNNQNNPNKGTGSYTSLRITSPTPDEPVNSCGGQYTISYTSEPALRSGDTARLLVDDLPLGEPTTSTNFDTKGLERGPHNVKVQILSQGQVVQESAKVHFNFMRNCAKH